MEQEAGMNLNLESRTAGAFMAAAAGDALGWTTEFMRSPGDLRSRLKLDRLTDFVGWKKRVGGRFHGYEDTIEPGDYSDDTQLAICTACSIDQAGRFDPLLFSKMEFLDWLEYARGAGGTVKFAAQRFGLKAAQWHSNFFVRRSKDGDLDYRDGGANGAAMRIAPHVLANANDWSQAELDIWTNSIISHGHPRAILGALLYGYALHSVLNHAGAMDSRELIQTVANSTKKLHIPDAHPFDSWRRRWNEGKPQPFEAVYAVTIQEAITQLRLIWAALRDSLAPEDTFRKLGCFHPATRGSGLGTALAGVYLYARRPNEPCENIILAANMIGTDTDSIAAFVAGLHGASSGLEAIPESWRSRVQDSAYLEKIGRHLATVSRRQPSNFKPHPGWTRTDQMKPVSSQDLDEGMAVTHRLIGEGRIVSLSRHKTLTKGQEVTHARIQFAVGQSCCFAMRGTGPANSLYKTNVSDAGLLESIDGSGGK